MLRGIRYFLLFLNSSISFHTSLLHHNIAPLIPVQLPFIKKYVDPQFLYDSTNNTLNVFNSHDPNILDSRVIQTFSSQTCTKKCTSLGRFVHFHSQLPLTAKANLIKTMLNLSHLSIHQHNIDTKIYTTVHPKRLCIPPITINTDTTNDQQGRPRKKEGGWL